MLSIFRNRFGIPGVIAVIALVFAMLGGAYAASDNAGTGAVASKAKQGKQGKPGKPGATGPTGPAGPAGPAGPKGDAGAKGETGSNGQDGEDGSPWTAGGTLPPGATQTGTWGGDFNAGSLLIAPISFSIPLAAEIAESHVKVMAIGVAAKPECENAAHAGVASPANPEAQPGYLCVYTAVDTTTSGGAPLGQAPFVLKGIGASPGASTAGAIAYKEGGSGESIFWGTFAVTGCGTGFPCL